MRRMLAFAGEARTATSPGEVILCLGEGPADVGQIGSAALLSRITSAPRSIFGPVILNAWLSWRLMTTSFGANVHPQGQCSSLVGR